MNKFLKVWLFCAALLASNVAGWFMALDYYDYDGLFEANEFKRELINAYDQYNKGAEELLDSIDKYDDWVDRFDNYDYYAGRAKVDSLCATQL